MFFKKKLFKLLKLLIVYNVQLHLSISHQEFFHFPLKAFQAIKTFYCAQFSRVAHVVASSSFLHCYLTGSGGGECERSSCIIPQSPPHTHKIPVWLRFQFSLRHVAAVVAVLVPTSPQLSMNDIDWVRLYLELVYPFYCYSSFLPSCWNLCNTVCVNISSCEQCTLLKSI